MKQIHFYVMHDPFLESNAIPGLPRVSVFQRKVFPERTVHPKLIPSLVKDFIHQFQVGCKEYEVFQIIGYSSPILLELQLATVMKILRPGEVVIKVPMTANGKLIGLQETLLNFDGSVVENVLPIGTFQDTLGRTRMLLKARSKLAYEAKE